MMKKYRQLIAIDLTIGILVHLLMVVCFISCTEPEFLKDDCATYDLGTVIVRNSSGIDLIVDVTFNELLENAPIMLHYYDDAIPVTYFRDVPRGRAVIWWRYEDEDWQHAFIDVESCEQSIYVINEEGL